MGYKGHDVDKEPPPLSCFLFIVAALCLLVGLFMVGWRVGAKLEQDKAIEAGVGKWTVDAKTGVNQFVYGKD